MKTTAQKKPKKKKDSHVSFRNSNLFCYHCGKAEIIPYPIGVQEFAKLGEVFTAAHINCLPVWKQPEPDMSLSAVERADWWRNGNGERGSSSEFMWLAFRFDGISRLPTAYAHPHDPDDFRRCYMLLKTVPEWKEKLHLLKPASEVWHKLVLNWNTLTQMLEEQQSGKENKMYEMMQGLGC